MKLSLPFGKSVTVSKEAGELAVAFDKFSSYPELANQFATTLSFIKSSVAMLDQVEKTSGRAGVQEFLKKNFPHV